MSDGEDIERLLFPADRNTYFRAAADAEHECSVDDDDGNECNPCSDCSRALHGMGGHVAAASLALRDIDAMLSAHPHDPGPLYSIPDRIRAIMAKAGAP